MATSYAALVSLINTIAMEQTPRPSFPPFPFDGALIQSLLQRVHYLVEFLEQGWKGSEHLETRISELAYAAEDAIESSIIDQIQSESGPASSCFDDKATVVSGQSRDLERMIKDLDSITAEVKLIKDQSGISLNSTGSSSAAAAIPHAEMNKMVGFDEEKGKIMEELAGNQSSRQVIPIVGMGGVGKTTLARNVYDDKFSRDHFDVRVWVTISQEYNVEKILGGVLSSLNEQVKDEMSGENLGDNVHKSLWGRKYLVIFDDMWSIDVWNEIQRFFPDNGNGSRVMVTTRLSNLAEKLSTFSLGIKCLDNDSSWNLLCERVFGERGSCPPELEEVGKKIAQNCRGLPLSIVVIGGLLAKSKLLEYWKQVAEDFSSSLYSANDEQCTKVLLLSYNHLPVQLKPCFLYLGIFPEDHEISVSKLTKLWIAEGFLKQTRGKILEEIAEDYLKDLVERNLIMVSKWGLTGKMKHCAIHDLLREFCLKEAQKEKFICVVTTDCLGVSLSMKCPRRIITSLKKSESKQYQHLFDSLRSTSHVHSLIVTDVDELKMILECPIFKSLKVLALNSGYASPLIMDGWISDVVRNLINLRYLQFHVLASHICCFRNLQMINIGNNVPLMNYAVSEFWDMPQLHHVKCDGFLIPEPSSGQHDAIVLENLRSIIGVENFKFDEAVIKRIPNVRKVKVSYGNDACEEWSRYGANNLDRLEKLESFTCFFRYFGLKSYEFHRNLAFPHSLKKLCLSGCKLPWEYMTVIGSLPHLELLKLRNQSFVGTEWSPFEGDFRCLKCLHMIYIEDLIDWTADSTHFPRLEQLYLFKLVNLKEIPLDVGEISTLRSIQLFYCSVSAMISAKTIAEEQLNFENDDLLVEVHSSFKYRSVHDSDAEVKNFVAKSNLDKYDDDELHVGEIRKW